MKEDNVSMPFLEHLEELRWRLVRSAIAILLVSAVIWFYQEWIIDTLFLSMKDPSFITYRLFCQYFNICIEEIPLKMQSTTMAGQFSYGLMMSVMGGVVVSFPYVFHQLWSFIKPGLKQNEKSAVKGLVFYVSILFFLGILFGYFIVAPLCVQFFGTYQISKNIENIFTISSYMSTIISTVFYSGLLFLLPVIAFILGKMGVVTAEFLRKYRKHSIVGVLIIAAVITPPDLISQIIVAIPIVLLYEISIIVVARLPQK
ncbi:MAG: twin-arginine translocase subunit TatC [Crocinitomicaceae bacterium]|nr:twin-arginine translocase subunit TatC [Crocinitomicaceae bacterium]